MRFSSPFLRFAALAVLTACTHGEPFRTPAFGSDQPLGQTSPAQLTWSSADDVDAAWLADESAMVFTSDRVDVGDVRCVMVLPPTGGRATRSICPIDRDTFNEYRSAAPGPDGRVVFVRMDQVRGARFPHLVELAEASLDAFRSPEVVLGVPFSLPGQPLPFTGVHQIRWIGPDAVVFRAGFDGGVCDAAQSGCSPLTLIQVSSGYGLVIQPLDPAAGGPTFVAGTDLASSVAVSPDGDAVYYTVTGQGTVYRLVRSTGVVTVVFDMPGVIVRDVQVAGNRLVAVAGGRVRAFVGQGVGLVQSDAGGDLLLVDIGTGAFTALNPPNTFFQHPALSPSGTRLIAESGGDLWLFNLP